MTDETIFGWIKIVSDIFNYPLFSYFLITEKLKIQKANLHKEPGAESLPDVEIVVLTGEICTGPLQVKPRYIGR